MESRNNTLRPLRLILLPLLLLGIALLSAGCVTLKDPEASQDYRADVVGVVSAGQTIGQTFVSRRPGLNEIQLWLRLASGTSPETGNVTFELFHSPDDSQPLAQIDLPVKYIATTSPVTIPIPPQHDPPGQSYYLRLSSSDSSIEALGRNEDVYPYGQAYINGQPQEVDLSFSTSYDYETGAFLVDLRRLISGLWLILPLLITLWVPGRLMLNLTGLDRHFQDWGERTALSIGLSLAAIPVLMTWTTFAGLHWSEIAVWIAGGLLSAILLWRLWPGWEPLETFLSDWRSSLRNHVSPIGMSLAAVFLFSLTVRLVMVRDLAAPLWVDSVHHGMITRLILEYGGFPPSYAPFLDIDTASYHAGFHSVVAVFIWLSGLEIPNALLVLGQVINALMVLAVYQFTLIFVKDRAAGVVAALITGIFSPMPAYLTSWGRYTQLTGLLILPVAMVLVKTLLDRPAEKRLPIMLLAGIASGGLFLTHYRVIAFFACLLIAYLAVQSLQPKNWRILPQWVGLTGIVAFTSILLTIPWWPATLSTLFIPKLAWGETSVPAFSDFSWDYLTSAMGQYTLALAGLGLLWGAVLRKSFVLIMTLWTGLLFLIANLAALHLPGGGFVNNTSVEISLFMPVSMLGGFLAGWLINAWKKYMPTRWHPFYYSTIGLAGVALALVGARSILPILNPTTMLFRQADWPAMNWIRENISPDETILINPFAWGYGLYAGNDGGYWIVPITGHKSMPPPVLYGLGNNQAKSRQISDLCRKVIEISNNPAELAKYLLSENIHYIYIGARGGSLSARALQSSPFYKLLYKYGDTWVFQVKNTPA